MDELNEYDVTMEPPETSAMRRFHHLQRERALFEFGERIERGEKVDYRDVMDLYCLREASLLLSSGAVSLPITVPLR